jgi:ApeA N-terminal domain 1
MEPFECQGIWWIPDRPGDKVAGKLKLDDEMGMTLALMGTLGETETWMGDKSHNLILGMCHDLPIKGEVTLVGCVQKGLSIGMPGYSRESYFIERTLVGGHFENAEALLFTSCSIQLSGLTAWTNSAIRVRDESPGSFARAVRFEPHETLTAEIPGGRIELVWNTLFSREFHRWAIEEAAQLRVVLDAPLSDQEWQEKYVYPLQNLFTFATDSPNRVDEVKFHLSRGQAVRLIRRRIYTKPANTDDFFPFRMLFTLDDVRDRFEDFLCRWLETHQRFDNACKIFFAGLYEKPSYLESQLLMVMQALELYYATINGSNESFAAETVIDEILAGIPTRARNRILSWLAKQDIDTFSIIIKDLFDKHSSILKRLAPQGFQRFVKEALDLRRYSLFRRGDPGTKNYAQRMFVLIGVLRTLMKTCLLGALEFNEHERQKLFQRNEMYGFLVEMVAKIYGHVQQITKIGITELAQGVKIRRHSDRREGVIIDPPGGQWVDLTKTWVEMGNGPEQVIDTDIEIIE